MIRQKSGFSESNGGDGLWLEAFYGRAENRLRARHNLPLRAGLIVLSCTASQSPSRCGIYSLIRHAADAIISFWFGAWAGLLGMLASHRCSCHSIGAPACCNGREAVFYPHR
jgi:hypothetical protein